MNNGASSSSGFDNDWCLACNDPHYQDSCPIYQHQVYLSKNNGVLPYEHEGLDPTSSGNFVNFNPGDVSILRVETRSTKRLLAPDVAKDDKRPFATSKRREEEDHEGKKGKKDKMVEKILKRELPNARLPPSDHMKGPILVKDDACTIEESREQVVQRLRFPSLKKIHRREQIDHFKQRCAAKEGMPQTKNSYNIIEDLKRTPSRVSLYDALKIPGQLDLLRASLKVMNEGLDSVLNLIEDARYLGMGKNRPPTFYISLELDGFIVHNCLIDFEASITVMPKVVCDIMGLQHTRASNGVLQLDGTNVKTVGVIKRHNHEVTPMFGGLSGPRSYGYRTPCSFHPMSV